MAGGKAFANRKKSEIRNKNDFYETPFSLTWELQNLNIIPIKINGKKTTILDPCCGNHAISKWFRKDYDITEKSLEYGNDFLAEDYSDKHYDFVIMNPPFDLWDNFVSKSKEIADVVISIGKTDYFSCYQRLQNGIWKNLKAIYIFNRKVDYQFPTMENGDLGVGSLTSGWFVWDKNYDGKPELNFIDIQKYANLGGFDSWAKKNLK